MIAKIDAVTYKLYRRKMGQNSLPQNKQEQLGFLDIILGKTTDFYCNLNKKGYICPKTWVFDPYNAPEALKQRSRRAEEGVRNPKQRLFMEKTRKLAVESHDGIIRMFATATDASKYIGCSVAAVSKSIREGKMKVGAFTLRDHVKRLFVVRIKEPRAMLICSMNTFGQLVPINTQNGDAFDWDAIEEVLEITESRRVTKEQLIKGRVL